MNDTTLKPYFEKYIQGINTGLINIKNNTSERTKLEELKQEIVSTVQSEGKIIFTGIGKNVFACQKLAASYSSIGIPSYFVDAVHAAHGDLGTIGENDLIIALSKSGNTSELINMLNHLTNNKDRFPNKIIGIDCHNSVVTENGFEIHCDKVIHLWCVEEIDEMDLVPTVSAVLLQIIGDIVGVGAAEILGLNKKIFRLNHPGGTIGETLKK